MNSNENINWQAFHSFDVMRPEFADGAPVFDLDLLNLDLVSFALTPLSFSFLSLSARPPSTSASTSRRSPSSGPSRRASPRCWKPSSGKISYPEEVASVLGGRCCCSWSGSPTQDLLSRAAPRPRTQREGGTTPKTSNLNGQSSSICRGKSSPISPPSATRSSPRRRGAPGPGRRFPTRPSGSRSARRMFCESFRFVLFFWRGKTEREMERENQRARKGETRFLFLPLEKSVLASERKDEKNNNSFFFVPVRDGDMEK